LRVVATWLSAQLFGLTDSPRQLQDTILEVDAVLRTTLAKALDMNTFHISNKTVTDGGILSSAILVDQTGAAASASPSPASLTNQLVSCPKARVIAVVDRSADIDAAAKAIATARFSFGGRSPYAPDLVLVNEFVEKAFFEACAKYATLLFAREAQASAARKVSGNEDDEVRRAVKEAEDKRLVSSFGSSDFKLVDVLDRCVYFLFFSFSFSFSFFLFLFPPPFFLSLSLSFFSPLFFSLEA
jgi:hypothetical protein